jgi:thioredoxin reductase (NADPH)
MRASKVMQERVKNTANIKIYWNSVTDEVLGDKKVQAVRIHNTKTDVKEEVPVSAFFVAIGHQPNSDIFKPFIDMDGDVQDKIYRQAVTAAGSGCMAALDAERYLSAKGFH